MQTGKKAMQEKWSHYIAWHVPEIRSVKL